MVIGSLSRDFLWVSHRSGVSSGIFITIKYRKKNAQDNYYGLSFIIRIVVGITTRRREFSQSSKGTVRKVVLVHVVVWGEYLALGLWRYRCCSSFNYKMYC